MAFVSVLGFAISSFKVIFDIVNEKQHLESNNKPRGKNKLFQLSIKFLYTFNLTLILVKYAL
jgi:hypothetical protein